MDSIDLAELLPEDFPEDFLEYVDLELIDLEWFVDFVRFEPCLDIDLRFGLIIASCGPFILEETSSTFSSSVSKELSAADPFNSVFSLFPSLSVRELPAEI